MKGILKKIDEEINESQHYGCESEYRAGLYKAKKIIQTEQKEEIERPKTRGDIIRESNESLADRLAVTECEYRKVCGEECDGCDTYEVRYETWIDYLNQPIESEE